MHKFKCAAGAATPNDAENTPKTYSGNGNYILSHDRELYKALFEIIPAGAKNAVSMDALANYYGADTRAVRQLIYNARCAGFVIAGDKHGYYRPDTRQELERYYNTARRRALSGLYALRAAAAALREGQA